MEFKKWLRLDEVHYTDYYGKNFEKFRKKYMKFKKDKSLFVQFTNYMDDVLLREPYSNPNHRDPVAIYAYPLWYVIDYPADIWYGSRAKYLRVLRDMSGRNKLILNYLDYNYASYYLYKAKLSYSLLSKAIEVLNIPKGKSQIPKAFFAVIQHEFSDEHEDGKKLRSGEEQTEILRKMGLYAIEDRATNNKKAVINDREPCQIAFLNPRSFKVEEIFDMGGGTNDKLETGTSRSPSVRNGRKLAALIANQLNDSIIESNLESKNQYYTKKGRLIKIDFNFEPSYIKTRRMGEKKHKEYKFSDYFETYVLLKGERKELSYQFGTDAKFEDIAKYMADFWAKQELVDNSEPYTYARSIADKKAEQEKQEKIREEEEKKNLLNDEQKMQPLLQEALQVANIDLKLSLDKYYYNTFKDLTNWVIILMHSRKKEGNIIVNRKDVEETVDLKNKIFKSQNFVDLYSPEGQKLIDLVVLYCNNPPTKDFEFYNKRYAATRHLEEFIEYMRNFK